jgi:ADP-heptose:LPS heptosyltransferase
MRPPDVLAIHPGALGDVLQAVPALRALRALDGGGRLSFAGQPRLARLLAGLGAIDAELPFDSLGLQHLFVDGPVPEPVRERLARFGRVVSWFGAHATPYADRLRALVQAPAVIAPPVPDEGSPVRVWEHLLATVNGWGVSGAGELHPLIPAAEWQRAAAATLTELGVEPRRPLLVVHPGAGGAAKRWPVDKHARVIASVTARAPCQVLVHRGPADEAAALDLLTALGERGVTALRLVEPELGLLAGVLAAATAYLGADSGVSHLAAAVGLRSVILFAPETRRRWTPWSATARIVTVTSDLSDVEDATALLRPLARCA